MEPFQKNIIFRKYGDFLYQKGDFDGAMQQDLKAIDNTEPSQVIRKVGFPYGVAFIKADQNSYWTHNEYKT